MRVEIHVIRVCAVNLVYIFAKMHYHNEYLELPF